MVLLGLYFSEVETEFQGNLEQETLIILLSVLALIFSVMFFIKSIVFLWNAYKDRIKRFAKKLTSKSASNKSSFELKESKS